MDESTWRKWRASQWTKPATKTKFSETDNGLFNILQLMIGSFGLSCINKNTCSQQNMVRMSGKVEPVEPQIPRFITSFAMWLFFTVYGLPMSAPYQFLLSYYVNSCHIISPLPYIPISSNHIPYTCTIKKPISSNHILFHIHPYDIVRTCASSSSQLPNQKIRFPVTFSQISPYGVFLKWGVVCQNGWFMMETPIKLADLGLRPF